MQKAQHCQKEPWEDKRMGCGLRLLFLSSVSTYHHRALALLKISLFSPGNMLIVMVAYHFAYVLTHGCHAPGAAA